ncbi:MAG: orotidine-5'-phosphate decarboxylase [Chloroflexi bacterium]|nr:orotidine-5'-phosphate decarboxylase [Chloroflexota bacterium]
MNFMDKLLAASRRNRSLLCVGLDPDPSLMPPVPVYDFCRSIVEGTADLVCAYKPNLAFFEALGLEGLTALSRLVAYIPRDIPVIGDAKRGDVGHSATVYARALFQTFGFDAATVNPYLGQDSVEPFLEYEEKGVFLLCRTSNPGSRDFQSLECTSSQGEHLPLFEVVAQRAQEWNTRGNIGLVVAATYPQDVERLRRLCPGMPFLIPGVGPQGGDLAAAVREGADARGEGAIIAVSRQVIYASRGLDFALAARKAALSLRREIEANREALL